MKHLEFLKNSFIKNKLSHAYLLSGNDSKSKAHLLSEFLSFLVCTASKKPCKKCKACKEALQFQHPDIALIEPEKQEITIAQIRQLQQTLSLGAWQSPLKIAVVLQAESMNQEAQSAFLKLLEEPRGETVFLLAVQHPAKLLSTIRSRAQELRLYQFSGQDPSTSILKEMQALPLVQRFEKAKEISESQQGLNSFLPLLLLEARLLLLCALENNQENVRKQRRLVGVIQEVTKVAQQTPVNPRLALERIFIEL